MAHLYKSISISGNLHDAARVVNKLGKGYWQVVAMDSDGKTTSIVYSVAVLPREFNEYMTEHKDG